MTEAMPKIAPTMPCHNGLLCNGTVLTIMMIAPEKTPDDPQPAIARPTMKEVELGAAPQMAEPISNRPMQQR